MAGEMPLAQLGDAINLYLLTNISTAADLCGSCWVQFETVNKVGAGDAIILSPLRKARLVASIFGTNGPLGGTTATLRTAAGGAGVAVSAQHTGKLVAAPEVQVRAGIAGVDIDPAVVGSLYFNCSDSIAGYMILIFAPVA